LKLQRDWKHFLILWTVGVPAAYEEFTYTPIFKPIIEAIEYNWGLFGTLVAGVLELLRMVAFAFGPFTLAIVIFMILTGQMRGHWHELFEDDRDRDR